MTTQPANEVQEFDNNKAWPEGWAIFDCDGSANGQWQLCKDDEQALFANDNDVWRFVRDKAEEGSAYHAAALEWIKVHNPIEYECIMKWPNPK